MAFALPRGITPSEIAFLAEMEMVTIVPRQRLEGLELLGVSMSCCMYWQSVIQPVQWPGLLMCATSPSTACPLNLALQQSIVIPFTDSYRAQSNH